MHSEHRQVCYHVVTHVYTAFFQVFLWERVGTLSPKPTQYDAMEMMEVEENGQVVERPDRPTSLEPRIGWV